VERQLAPGARRSSVGSSQPPDEFGLIEEGSDWGNPWCLRRQGKACAHVAQPLATLGTHAVVDGIAFLPDTWGARYASTAVASEWALGKLIAIALKPRGSSFSATPSVLITGLENPGPVAATSDGALLVGEYRSGTIYRIAPGTPEPGETQTRAPSSAAPAAATLTIAANANGALKFAQASLTAKAGATTIAFSNPAVVPHDVEIARDGHPLVRTETIADSTTSTEATLKPRTYMF
jgi:plastocyanin